MKCLRRLLARLNEILSKLHFPKSSTETAAMRPPRGNPFTLAQELKLVETRSPMKCHSSATSNQVKLRYKRPIQVTLLR